MNVSHISKLLIITLGVIALLFVAIYQMGGIDAANPQTYEGKPANINMGFEGEIPVTNLDESHPLSEDQQKEVDKMYPTDPGV